MRRTVRASALAVMVAAALAAAPAMAAVFTVHLTNGSIFESRYEPRDAFWDAQKVTLLDETGNIIALAKSDIDRIESDVAAKGFGHMLDDTTMAFGWAPNDTDEASATDEIASSTVTPSERSEPIYEVNETPATPIFYGVSSEPVGVQPAPQPVIPPAL